MELALRVFAATLFADLGVGLGSAVQRILPRRLHLMVWFAAGVMLAVIGLDIAPETAEAVGWGGAILALASGCLVAWAISRRVFHVCPACAIAEIGDGSGLGLGRGVQLLMIALGAHSLLDGIAIAGDLEGHMGWGMMVALSVHKFPEGLALMLLLTGAGLSRSRALSISLGIEALTALGAAIAGFAFRHVSPTWPILATAHVAGSFLFLIWTTATSARRGSLPAPRPVLFLAGGVGFAATALFLTSLSHP